MATERQILANRLNAMKSTGPKTAAGKARSRTNAIRHGLTCATQRSSAAAGLSLDGLVDRLARIDAEMARLLMQPMEALCQRKGPGINCSLRRLYALQRYADRCHSRLRKQDPLAPDRRN